MKVLITGAVGYIGAYLAKFLSKRYDVIATDCCSIKDAATRFEFMDILDKDAVEKMLSLHKPDCVIHLAGIKNLNFCEKNKSKVYNVNVTGTENLVNTCKGLRPRVIFFSTDYVFDGAKGLYDEEGSVNPQTYYGVTKVEAEKLIMSSLDNYVVIRTGGVFGSYDSVISPLFSWLLDNLKAGKPVDAFIDIYNTPTSLNILGEGLDEIIKSKSNGLFHLAGLERINRFDFFKRIARHYGFDEGLIVPVKNKEDEESFMRPKDISLNSAKIHDLFKIRKGSRLIIS